MYQQKVGGSINVVKSIIHNGWIAEEDLFCVCVCITVYVSACTSLWSPEVNLVFDTFP